MTTKSDFAITDIDKKQAADVFKSILVFLATHDCVLTLWEGCSRGNGGSIAQFEERGSLVRRIVFGEHSYRVTAKNVAAVLTALDVSVLSRKPWGISIAGKAVCLSRSCDDISLSSTEDVSEREIESLLYLLRDRRLVTKWNRIEE